MNLAKFSTSQPVLVNMTVLVVLLAGMFTFQNITKEKWPDIGSTHALIQVRYPGASPREVEKLVTIPIEEQIEGVQQVDTVESVSSEGQARLFVEFDSHITQDEFNLRLQELQREVGATPDLPEDADDPAVTSFRFGNSRVINVALRGDAPEAEFQRAARDLEDALQRIRNVERVEIAGKREREIWVEIDPHLLHSYGLSLQDVIGALRRANQNVAGGTVESGPEELLVRTVGEVDHAAQLRDLVVKRGPAGERVYLADVARLREAFEDATTLGRVNGVRSADFEVHKVVGGDSVRIVEDVRRALGAQEARLPEGVDIVTFGNTAVDIENRLSALYWNGLMGLTLVLICLYFFVGPRPAIMTALGIPFSILLTFVAMSLFGMTINLITLFSLIITIGMIVDDGIVVTENVYRYYEQGLPRYQAVVRGASEVAWPVIAAVMTTVAAFLPLMLMTGWLGKFMAFIPKTVIIALLASLVECLFILPSHLFDFPPKRLAEGNTGGHHRQRRRWLRSLTALYAVVLRRFLRFRYAVVVGILALAGFSVWLATTHVDLILFGGRDAEMIEVQFEVRDGTKLEETLKAATILEASALEYPRDVVEWVFTTVGRKGWRATRANVSNAAEVELDLVPSTERDVTSKEIVRALREEAARYPVLRNVIFEEEYEGPDAGEAVALDISGDNFDMLRKLADDVKAYLRGVPGVHDIRDNYLGGKDEIQIMVDEDKAHLAHLDLRTIAETARAALFGVEATTFYDEDEDVPVRVRYEQAARQDFTDLDWLEIVNGRGQRVPFTNVASTVREPGMARIYRYEDERTITVYANVEETVTTSQKVNQKLEQEFSPRLAGYPGYTFHFGGEHEETNRSVASLRQALLVGIILIYMILGTQFKSFIQPLVIMTAVPFSLIGVVIGFFLLDEPLGMMSMIGAVALAGIVVNDSLILVDFINRNRADGMAKRESVVHSGMIRLRPILLTSITTIAGVMPIAFGMFGTDRFLKPMAIAIGWGLTFATVLTLLVIPVFYVIVVDDLQPRLAAVAARLRGGGAGTPASDLADAA